MKLKAYAQYATRLVRSGISDRLDSRWNKDPLAARPTATAEEFLSLAGEAAGRTYAEADKLESETSFAIDKNWLDELALHTQIVKKQSQLSYVHGRLLYSLLRRYISDNRPSFVSILETGTARGFSAICMAKALDDAGVNGHVITIDRLPHLNPIFWNCIDDLDGKKTRRELLEPWRSLCDRITFLQGDTLNQIRKVGLNRVNFAYLDAQHSREDVLNEFAFVKRLQFKGDIVFFDDVTREQFPGVCDAVDELEQREDYFVHRIRAGRGFAWAIRK